MNALPRDGPTLASKAHVEAANSGDSQVFMGLQREAPGRVRFAISNRRPCVLLAVRSVEGLQKAVLEGKLQAAMHSLKDMPGN